MSKATFVIATAGHARHLLAQAEARVQKFTEAYQAAVADVEKYTELAKTLPESAGKPAVKKVNYEVGQGVTFAYGRGETRVNLDGVIKAKNEDGTQYLIAVGTGFDEKSYKVFGGSIVGSKPGAQDNGNAPGEVDPLAPTEDDASAPETPPADDLPFTPDTPESSDDPLAA